MSRGNWRRVKFSEMAENITERVHPTVEDSKTYIGLEHLDSGSLHIKRWGSNTELIGQKLRMKKGDIIFGKRNAYLKRVAIAPFDGICSAHSMVLRAKPETVLPEFLPFFMQSDIFMDRAIMISVGSLSPTINWSTLKQQEFLIPPINEQQKIAEILWAADEAVEKYLNYKKSLEMLYEANLHKHLFSSTSTKVKIGDIGSINRKSLSEKTTPAEYTFKYIDIGSVVAPRKLGVTEVYRFENAPSRARRCVQNGDILVSTVRPNLKSFVRLSNLHGDFIASTGFAVITPKNAIFGSLIYHSIFSKQFEIYCNDRVTGTNYPTISAKDIGNFEFSLPTDLVSAARELDSIEELINITNTHINTLQHLKMKLVNNLIQGGAIYVQ